MTAIGVDGKPLEDRPNSYRVTGVQAPRRAFSPSTKRFIKWRQQRRHRELIADDRVVRVGTRGATVFRGEGAEYPWERAGYRPVAWADDLIIPEPPVLTPQQRKRRVARWMANHPGETPREELD